MDTPTRLGTIKKSVLTQVVQSRHPLRQTAIMKFVSLALALLLAVGSHAASLQADAPSQLEHLRSAVDMYLLQVKESAKKALDGLDGTDYSDLKVDIASRLDNMHTQLKAMQGAVSPVTDSIVSTISDATSELRTSIMNDIDDLKVNLEPHRNNLRTVVMKHIEEYRTHMEPVMKEYYEKHNAEMETLKTKMAPVMAELREKVTANVEETKAALMPIVESVRSKINDRLESLKTMVTPYVEEYKDQLKQAYDQAKGFTPEQLTELRGKISPLAEEIKTKFETIFSTIRETIMKQ